MRARACLQIVSSFAFKRFLPGRSPRLHGTFRGAYRTGSAKPALAIRERSDPCRPYTRSSDPTLFYFARVGFLRNTRKTECGAIGSSLRLAVRGAAFALPSGPGATPRSSAAAPALPGALPYAGPVLEASQNRHREMNRCAIPKRKLSKTTPCRRLDGSRGVPAPGIRRKWRLGWNAPIGVNRSLNAFSTPRGKTRLLPPVSPPCANGLSITSPRFFSSRLP